VVGGEFCEHGAVAFVIRSVTTLCATVVLAAGAVGFVGGGVAHAATCSTAHLPLPDSSCTPGSYNSDVTQSTIHSTICVSGWTSTVRPPTSYTNPLKVQGIADYGYSDANLADYEEDHLVPLELGGSPRDHGNLWPEPHYGTKTAYTKDGVENSLSAPATQIVSVCRDPGVDEMSLTSHV
jgi:hypothetical protein